MVRSGPSVPCDIGEDRDPPVELAAWLAVELHSRVSQSCVGSSEVLHVQEQPNPAGELFPYGPPLRLTVGSGQKQASLRPRRLHHDPALWPAGSGQGRLVLYQFETEDVEEERDRLVVVVHDQSHQVQCMPGSQPRHGCCLLAHLRTGVSGMARVKTESTSRGRVAPASQVSFALAAVFHLAVRPEGQAAGDSVSQRMRWDSGGLAS